MRPSISTPISQLASRLRLGRRHFTTGTLPPPFQFHSSFLTLPEQHVLLTTALRILDDTTGSRAFRKRIKMARSKSNPELPSTCTDSLQRLFLPEDQYEFEEGHYDNVIHNFRETHLSSWPTDTNTTLPAILHRLHSLCPSTSGTQTHLLHLSSTGEILPHIDNTQASGSWILGISLGAERILRMQSDSDSFDVLLPSGSVYLQQDIMRFKYRHSILKDGIFEGRRISGGQRLSVMIRDKLPMT